MATTFPHRKLHITVEHPTAGDSMFSPLVFSALEELGRRDPYGELMEYVAGNGVRISFTR